MELYETTYENTEIGEQKPARGPEHVHINQLEKSIEPFLPSNGWYIKMRTGKYIGLLTMWANEKVLNTVETEKA